jgi:hypothetical protein
MLTTQESLVDPLFGQDGLIYDFPHFCQHRICADSVTSVTESSCCTHGHKLVLGADTRSNPSYYHSKQ